MARKLKQIDSSGTYFHEEMLQIVSITFNSRIPIGIFLIIAHLVSFSILLIVFTFRFKLMKYLILQGLSGHHLTPNELVTVLHATKISLGWSISDTEIREGKLTDLLIKEDFNVPA